MAALTKTITRRLSVIEKVLGSFPMAAVQSYGGSFLSINSSGYVRPLNTSDSKFAGMTQQEIDNSAGSAGDEDLVVIRRGIVEVIVDGVDNINDVDTAVYMTSDNDFTLTSSGAIQVGKVSAVLNASTGLCRVYFEATSLRSV